MVMAVASHLACPDHGGSRTALLAWRSLLTSGETATFLCSGGHYITLSGIPPSDVTSVMGLTKILKKLEAR